MTAAEVPDGLHFGLEEETHHAIDALGSTDLKAILSSPVQFQAARLAKKRPELELLGPARSKEDEERVSAGKRYGHCVHAVALEGFDVFEARYAAKPEQPEGLLITREQIREALGDRCTLPRSAGLHDYIVEARHFGLEGLEGDWLYQVTKYMEGREEISRRWHTQMVMLDRMLNMKRADHLGQSIRERYLSNGYPEVTVVWTDENGIRLKARFDWLRIKAILDVKTYAMREGQETIQSFLDAVERYAYDMQAMHYLDARAQMPRLIGEGKVYYHGDHAPVSGGWLTQLGSYPAEKVVWSWLAIQTVGQPEIDVVEPDTLGLVFAGAKQMVLAARHTYLEYSKRFGADELWYAARGLIRVEDMSFRPSISNRGTERWTTLQQ